jgi:hypothetical protein
MNNTQKAMRRIYDAFSSNGGNSMKMNFSEMERGQTGQKDVRSLKIPSMKRSRLYVNDKGRVVVNSGIRGTFSQAVDIQNRVLRLSMKKETKVLTTPLWISTKNSLGWNTKEVKDVYRYIADKKTVYFFTDARLLDHIIAQHKK